MLGEEVHEQSVLCGEYNFRCVCAGTFEYANQPPTGLVLGIPQVPVQHGPGIYIKVETLRMDGYLTLILLTHGELTTFHRLMKHGQPLSLRKAHPSPDIYSYKCAAGLKTLLVEYLRMQNRHLTDEERSANTREEMREVNGGIPLLTELCLVMRSDPLKVIRGLGEGVTCVYGPAVTYAFPDPLVAVYRHSVVHVSLISILDGTALNWCRQEDSVLREDKRPRANSAQIQGSTAMQDEGKREGPIQFYPKF